MLDLKVIRQDPERVRRELRRRGMHESLIDEVLEADRRRRELLQEVEGLRAGQKRVSADAPRLTSAAKDERIAQGRELAERLRRLEPDLRAREEELDRRLRALPNLTHESVPEGDVTANVVVRIWGTPAELGFQPRDHVDLGARLGILDLERGAKVASSRFYYLLGDGVLLEMALVRYALDILVARGFTPAITPFLVRPEVITGAWGGVTFDAQQTYKVAEDDLALIGTSEQSLAGFYMDEVLEAERLPVRFAGVSWCFRREAGSYGRDVRGLFRVHQFDKVEMFSYCHPDRSWEEHEFLLSIEEQVLQGLGIPYRVVLLSTGDTGAAMAKTYDIEAWMPGRGGYAEITSCSNALDFQARRLRVQFQTRGQRGREYVHTLNGTAIATSRALIAVLENYQQEDGSVRIPEVLVAYMNGRQELRGVRSTDVRS